MRCIHWKRNSSRNKYSASSTRTFLFIVSWLSTITSDSNWLWPFKSIIPKVLLRLTNWSSQVCVHESALSIWNSTKYAKSHKSQLLSKSKAQCPKIKRLVNSVKQHIPWALIFKTALAFGMRIRCNAEKKYYFSFGKGKVSCR